MYGMLLNWGSGLWGSGFGVQDFLFWGHLGYSHGCVLGKPGLRLTRFCRVLQALGFRVLLACGFGSLVVGAWSLASKGFGVDSFICGLGCEASIRLASLRCCCRCKPKALSPEP